MGLTRAGACTVCTGHSWLCVDCWHGGMQAPMSPCMCEVPETLAGKLSCRSAVELVVSRLEVYSRSCGRLHRVLALLPSGSLEVVPHPRNSIAFASEALSPSLGVQTLEGALSRPVSVGISIAHPS